MTCSNSCQRASTPDAVSIFIFYFKFKNLKICYKSGTNNYIIKLINISELVKIDQILINYYCNIFCSRH